MSQYLVTGGLGAIGAPLVRALLAEGHSVRILDNGSRGSTGRLQHVRGKVDMLLGDIRDRAFVFRALRGIDRVCHLASVNGTRHFYDHPAYVLDVGVKGIVNVIDGCIRSRVRELAVASSSEVYQTPPTYPTDETVPLSIPDPRNPRYSYAGAKIISELMSLHYAKEHFDRVIIFRPHNVFGPDLGWDHVIPELITRLAPARTEKDGEVDLPIQGSGDQTRSFIYIEDFVAALLMVLAKGESGSIYHIGTSEEISIREVATAIADCLNVRARIVPTPKPAGGTMRRCPDVGRLQRLGFLPRYRFREALPATVSWYVQHPAPPIPSGTTAPPKLYLGDS